MIPPFTRIPCRQAHENTSHAGRPLQAPLRSSEPQKYDPDSIDNHGSRQPIVSTQLALSSDSFKLTIVLANVTSSLTLKEL